VRIFPTLGDDCPGVIARRKLLVLAVAVLAPLTAVGASAAMEGDPPAEAPPVEEAPHGAAVSAAAQDCPTGPEHGPCVAAVATAGPDEDDEAEAPEDEDVAEEGDDAAGPPEGTHGAAVSAAAHECPPGPEHGPCVAAVASSKAKAKAGDDAETGDDDADGEGGGRPEGVGEQGQGRGRGGPPAERGQGGGRP
jgi:hypothetical protein